MVKEEIFVQLESRTYSHKKNKSEREKLDNGGSFHCESILVGFFSPLVTLCIGKKNLTDPSPHSN